MRTAALVALAYVLAVLVGALWRLVPGGWTPLLVPDVIALTAAYLGLTAHRGVAPAVTGAVVLGYLGDLLSGSPPGLLSLSAGLTALVAHAAHSRILVRGPAATLGFSAFVGAASGCLLMALRSLHDLPLAAPGVEVPRVIAVAVATGLAGPLVLRWYRRLDAAFARTQRERDHALEGLAP